jgi:hypothetical protein
MAKAYDAIDAPLAAWIMRQPMFFVGTAPSGDGGHVNISPKGPISTFRVLDEHTVAYVDLRGSGAETVAHVRQNGRIVVMFCSFDAQPRILRLHGRGEVLDADAIDFPDADIVPQQARKVIRVEVARVADACGYGVPVMRFERERDNARRSVQARIAKEGPNAPNRRSADRNAVSIDGLPAIEYTPRQLGDAAPQT